MGVMASVGSAWERGARRRHQRRLEVLHAKAELKAAQAAARGKRRCPRHPSPPPRRLDPRLADATAVGRAAAPARDTRHPARAPVRVARRGHRALARVRARRREDHRLPGDERRAPAAHGRVPARQAHRRRAAPGIGEGAPHEGAARRVPQRGRRLRGRLRRRRARRPAPQATRASPRSSASGSTPPSSSSPSRSTRRPRPAERQLAYRRVREELDGLISLSDERDRGARDAR